MSLALQNILLLLKKEFALKLKNSVPDLIYRLTEVDI